MGAQVIGGKGLILHRGTKWLFSRVDNEIEARAARQAVKVKITTSQALTTPEFFSSQLKDPASSTTGNMPAVASRSTPPVEITTESPQPAPLAIIMANSLARPSS